ncbi:MAG: hypothetical protein R6W77_13735 [Trueperaceae bacterium]
MVRLELLGAPRVLTDDGVLPLPATRVGCLVAFAAVEGDWVRRDRLLALLWPNDDEPTARANLRQLLQKTREPYRSLLERTPDAVRVLASSDVVDADLAEIDQRWNDLAFLHRGPFLDGFTPRDADAFDTWADEQRGRYTARWSRVIERALETAVASGTMDEAERLANLWLERDTLDAEIALRCAADLTALGAPASARALLERHAGAVRAAELEPFPAVTEMLRDLASGEGRARHAQKDSSGTVPPGAFDARGLIGRSEELAALDRWWQTPGRWLTLVAPGGMGKTSLALAWSTGLRGKGVSVDVVSVAGLDDPEQATRRVLDALRHGSRSGRAGFAELLGDAEVLVVVDAAETLPDATPPFPTWLREAAGLRLLVTSRKPWDHADNVNLLLAGLATVASEAEPSPAARLLWRAACAAMPGEDDTEVAAAPPDAIERAVRRIGGWPLGLELMAGWARWLGRDDWLEALASRPDELATDDRSAALIAASWEYLSEPRRTELTRLAAIPQPWTADDARSIDVGPASLRELVAGGWVSGTENTFTMHPLLVKHAVLADPPEAERTRARHARRVAEEIIRRFEQAGAFPAYTQANLPHLRATWAYACETRDVRLLAGLLEPLSFALTDGCAYETWAACLDEASAALDPAFVPAGDLRALERGLDLWRRTISTYTHDDDVAEALHDRLLQEATADDDRYALARLAWFRAVRALNMHEDLEEGQREAEAGEALLEACDDRLSLFIRASLANVIGVAHHRAGDLDRARATYERAIALAHRAGGPICATDMEQNLSMVDEAAGHFGRALASTAEQLRIVLEARGPFPAVAAWRLRGSVLASYGDTVAARACLERAVARCADLGPLARREELPMCQSLLVRVELMEGRVEDAVALLERIGPEPWTFEHRARLALLQDDLDGAEAAAAAAVDYASELPSDLEHSRETTAIRAIHTEVRVRRDGVAAWPAVAAAIAAARTSGCPPDAATALVPAADWLRAAGKLDVARRLLADVRAAATTRHETRLACTARLETWDPGAADHDDGEAARKLPAPRSVMDWLDEVERFGNEASAAAGQARDSHVRPSVP